MHIPFQVIMPDVDETVSFGISADRVSEMLAVRKVNAVIKTLPPQQGITWILGADTLIVKDGKLYGKPADHKEAAAVLKKLQGTTHEVMTSVALYRGRTKTMSSRTAVTRVTFSSMSEAEIEWYVNTGDWHGAAGGYRIQGLASCFITKIEGTTSCVAGLPISTVYDMLKEQGYSILD
jgi:septum formation protein